MARHGEALGSRQGWARRGRAGVQLSWPRRKWARGAPRLQRAHEGRQSGGRPGAGAGRRQHRSQFCLSPWVTLSQSLLSLASFFPSVGLVVGLADL